MSTQVLRDYAAKLRSVSAAINEKADFLDQRASEVEANLSGLESLLGGINIDFASVVPATAAAVATTSGKGKGRGRPKGSTNKAKTGAAAADGEGEGKLSLRKLILQILKENRGGLALPELVQECLTRGYKSKTKGHFSNIVYQNLHKMVKDKQEVAKADDKRYRLVKAA